MNVQIFITLISILFTGCSATNFYYSEENSEVVYQIRNTRYLVKKKNYKSKLYFVRYELNNYQNKVGIISFELNLKKAIVFTQKHKLERIVIDSILNPMQQYDLFNNNSHYWGTRSNKIMNLDRARDSYDSRFDKFIFLKSNRKELGLPEILFIEK